MFSFFSHSGYFYVLIVALLAVSLFAIFSMGEEDRKARKKREDQLLEERQLRAELEKTIQEKALEYKESVESLAKTLREKEAEFAGRVSASQTQLAEQEKLKSEIASLKSALAQAEVDLKQAVSVKENLLKDSAPIKVELDKVNKELALSNQMYNGLKEQYNELEEKFSQLFEEFLKEQKKNLPQSQSQPLLPPQSQSPQQVKLPKIPNLRSTVQQENEGSPASSNEPRPG
jgi:chromosome segregation ATPase